MASTVSTTANATTTAASGATYKVSPGDTLTKIAKKFNTSAAAIMAANKIVDANKLKVGVNLMIPQKSEKRSMTDSPAPMAPTQTASVRPDLVMNR
jgi:LysM repeat protein